jgi:hypothetical protein
VGPDLGRDVLAHARAGEAVEALDERHVLEAQGGQQGEEFCLRQSARDSGRPQMRIHALVLVQVRLQQHVRQVQEPPGPEHATDLREDG